MEKLPYIISGDLDMPGEKTRGIEPCRLAEFRACLTNDLEKQGKLVSWIESGEIRDYFRQNTRRSRLPVLSIDDRYIPAGTSLLGLSRAVSSSLDDEGIAARAGFRSVEEQLNAIAAVQKEIMLVDDVIFSGDMAVWVVDQLAVRDIKVKQVVAGIAIKEGMEKIAGKGIDVAALYSYEWVEDEVCERDFAFVPGSGRRMASSGANALYWDAAYGRPPEWASIRPDAALDFTASSLERSLRLLKPDTTMGWVGRMNGYATDGLAANALRQRMEVL